MKRAFFARLSFIFIFLGAPAVANRKKRSNCFGLCPSWCAKCSCKCYPTDWKGGWKCTWECRVLILCKACRARGQIRHFRNEKGSGAEMCAVIHSGIVARHRAGQLLANFFHVPYNSPRSLYESWLSEVFFSFLKWLIKQLKAINI